MGLLGVEYSGEHADQDLADPALVAVLKSMHRTYTGNPQKAVRGQAFIKLLHKHIAKQIDLQLSDVARKAGVKVVEEARVLGSHKPKDVDVAVIHPTSGPLLIVGVRSQMTSIGNNVLTYYQDIVGEAVSLQERYPMTTFGYAYLHPTNWRDKEGRLHTTDYSRYAKLYASISGRDDVMYKQLRGIYDEFAYLLVDFEQDPILLRDDLLKGLDIGTELSIATLTDRLIKRMKRRTVWLDLFT